jgi:exodeoxyribonuclease VII large subunit
MSQTTWDLENQAKDSSARSEAPPILSVSQLNRAIRSDLEGQFGRIWVRGEISNFKHHSSGHQYFSLKDQQSQVQAVMFRGHNSKLKFRPEDGLEVLVRGKITVYEPRGNYQVFCESMEPVGAGALQKAFEQLKEKLQNEGLFDVARKRPLPAFPKHLAIVTSPTGAAIQDMVKVLSRRARGLRVTLVPALVQGDQAAASIVEAMARAQRLPDVDVIIVGRGGGSLEDLWPFNEERVARAIAGSRVPVISAVGHEVDYTIADFVADLRAPTPSAAAEIVVQDAQALVERVKVLSKRLLVSVRRFVEVGSLRLRQMQYRLVDPRQKLQDMMIRCDELDGRLAQALRRNLLDKNRDLKAAVSKLDALSPLAVVARGYSLVRRGADLIRSCEQVRVGEEMTVLLARGTIGVAVTSVSDQGANEWISKKS